MYDLKLITVLVYDCRRFLESFAVDQCWILDLEDTSVSAKKPKQMMLISACQGPGLVVGPHSYDVAPPHSPEAGEVWSGE